VVADKPAERRLQLLGQAAGYRACREAARLDQQQLPAPRNATAQQLGRDAGRFPGPRWRFQDDGNAGGGRGGEGIEAFRNR